MSVLKKSMRNTFPRRISEKFVVPLVGGVARLSMSFFNVKIHNQGNHEYLKHVTEGPQNRNNRALITVSNHESEIDDPAMWGAILPQRLIRPKNLRWIPGAREIIFSNIILSCMFWSGRVYPIVRGDGVYQEAMRFSLELMDNKEWIHMYPEAKVNQTGKLFPRLKWGVGRLLYEPEITPLLIPFYQKGFGHVFPLDRPVSFLPKRKIDCWHAVIGEAVDLAPVVRTMKVEKIHHEQAYSELTHLVWKELSKLEDFTREIVGEKNWIVPLEDPVNLGNRS